MPNRLRFVLRDDDSSFFTDPAVLEEAYGRASTWCPVSLAVIPFAVESHHAGDPARFHQGTDPRPLGENAALVRFLRQGCSKGRFGILLHGWQHRYVRSPRAGTWIPEFVHVTNPRPCLEEGRAYLRDLLGPDPTVFVPPSNALSARSYAAVRSLGLHLTNFHALRLSLARPAYTEIRGLVPRLRARARRAEYHDVLHFGSRREIAAIPITPRASSRVVMGELIRRHRLGGAVCLATHHWELDHTLVDGTGSVRDLLNEALSWLRRVDAQALLAHELLV